MNVFSTVTLMSQKVIYINASPNTTDIATALLLYAAPWWAKLPICKTFPTDVVRPGC